MKLIAERYFCRLSALASGPIARGSIVSLGVRVAGMAIAFVQSVMLARLLSVEQFGIFSVAVSAAQVGATLATLGYANLAIRRVAVLRGRGDDGAIRPFINRALAVLAAVTIVLFALAAATWGMFEDGLERYKTVYAYAVASIPLLALLSLFRGLSLGFGDVMGAMTPGEVIKPLAMLLALATCAVSGFDLSALGAMILLLAAICIALVLSTVAVAHRLSSNPSVGSTRLCLTGFTQDAPLPFLGLALAMILQGELSTLMLAVLSDPEQAGLYQPVTRLTALLLLPMQAAGTRFDSRAAELHSWNDHARLQQVTSVFTLSTTGLTIAVALALSVLAPLVLSLFGPEFVTIAPALWVLSAAYVVVAMLGPASRVQLAAGNPNLAVWLLVISLLSNIALCAMLIPPMGALGAALAAAAGLVLNAVIQAYTVRRSLGIITAIGIRP